MSGPIDLSHLFILITAGAAIVTDLRWRKIFNWLTFSSTLAALVFSSYLMGWTGAQQALLGLSAGFLLYGWMFGLRIVGGGDVKLLMAFGAWGGFHYAVDVALLGVLLGGVLSLVTLAVRGKLFDFIRRMYQFVLSLYVKELEVQLPKIDNSLTIPFGVPISLAAVWVAFSHPLKKWDLYFGSNIPTYMLGC